MNTPPIAFAARNRNDKIRRLSTSGGLFSALAEGVLRRGGVVFGCVIGADLKVCHVAARTAAELAPMRGSKYVESDTRDAYIETRKILDAGGEVLFTGTPCQTAGLKAFLGGDRENLLTVSVFCRGAMTRAALTRYRTWLERTHGKKVTDIRFRSKEGGSWTRSRAVVTFADGTLFSECVYDNAYFRSFDASLKPACYHCAFREGKGLADLSIGDFWGIRNVCPEMDDGGGTSAVLVWTKKGAAAFDACDVKRKKVSFQDVVAGNPNLITDPPRQLRIGVLTFHRAFNCGAVLQAWALQTVLERMGHDVSFPNCNHVGYISPWRLSRRPTIPQKILYFCGWIYLSVFVWRGWRFRRAFAFGRFLRQRLHVRACRPSDFFVRYDRLIIGSDQVWNVSCSKEDAPLFLGETVDPEVSMIGYAVSAGDAVPTSSECARLRKAVARFDAVSYRESSLRDRIDPDAAVVCDPTLLLTAADYAALACPKRLIRDEYLFVYCVSDADETLAAARRLATRLGIREVAADVYRPGERRRTGVSDECPALVPDRFLALVRDAKYVVVSSFHGCVFSILYKKPFVCFYGNESLKSGTKVDENGRQRSFLDSVGASAHRLPATASTEAVLTALQAPIPDDTALVNLRTASLAWLKNVGLGALS